MRFTVNVDCTPEEARSFFGLPDVTELHRAYLGQMEKMIREGVAPADLERFVRAWLPGFGNWEQWQQTFWKTATGGSGGQTG